MLPKTGKLVALTDALFARCEGEEVMIVSIHLRPVSRDRAVFVALVTLRGSESEENWREAFRSIPESVRSRIVALVSDDSPGLARYARLEGWIHQRCHFHLIARLRVILGRRKTVRFKEERARAYELAMRVVTERNVYKIGAALRELRAMGANKKLPRLLRLRVNGLTRTWRAYRLYRAYPRLRLPTTSNAVESGGSFIREMLRMRRGFRTMQSLRRWLQTVLLQHQTMACRRTKIQPN